MRFAPKTKQWIWNRKWYFWLFFLLSIILGVTRWVDYQSGYLMVKTSLQQPGTQQVFFDDGQGFRESLSTRTHIEEPFQVIWYRIPLKTGPIHQLRLDPADTAGWVKFFKFSIKHKGSFRAVPLLSDSVQTSGIRKFHFDSEGSYWKCTSEYGNTDPYLIISNLPTYKTSKWNLMKDLLFISVGICIALMTSFVVETAFRKGWLFAFFKILNYPVEGLRIRWIRIILTVIYGILLLLGIHSLLPEKPSPITHVQFHWTGGPVSYIQMEADTGNGFSNEQTRLFWNRGNRNELDLNFRVKSPSIRHIRISAPVGSASCSISSLGINLPSSSRSIQPDLANGSISEGSVIDAAEPSSVTFHNNGKQILTWTSAEIN